MTVRVKSDGATMNHTPGSAVTAGDVIEFTGSVGVAIDDIASGATGALLMRGVVELPKDNNLVITQGDAVYWDATNDEVDKTNTNIPCGIAWTSEVLAATTVQVSLGHGALHES